MKFHVTFLLFTILQISDSLIPLESVRLGGLTKPCYAGSSVMYKGTCIDCLLQNLSWEKSSVENETNRILMCSGGPYFMEQVKIREADKFLQGRTLKMITVIRPPFVEVKNGEYDGVVIEVLNALQRKHNFSRVIHLREDNKWGSVVNGSWVGMVGQVYRGEMDIGITGFSVIYERSKVIEFTMAFHQEPAAILIPAPREGNKLTILVRPFQFEVWLTVFATICVLGPALYVLHIMSLRIRGELDKAASHETANGPVLICDLFQFIIGSLVQEGLKSPVQKTTKFVVILWWFLTLVVANIYTGYMVSFLSAPKLHDLVEDLDGLVNQRELKWTYRRSTAIDTLFSQSQSGTYRKVFQGADQNDLAKSDFEGVSKVATGKYAFLKEKSFIDVALSDAFYRTRSCTMTTAKHTFFNAGFAFILQKGSALLELINLEIGRSLTTGLMEKWKKEKWPRHLECENAASYILSTQPKTRKLTLDDCQGANFLLICGLSFASLAFLVELLLTHRKKLRVVLWKLGFLIRTSSHSRHRHRHEKEKRIEEKLDMYKIIVIPVKERFFEKMNSETR